MIDLSKNKPDYSLIGDGKKLSLHLFKEVLPPLFGGILSRKLIDDQIKPENYIFSWSLQNNHLSFKSTPIKMLPDMEIAEYNFDIPPGDWDKIESTCQIKNASGKLDKEYSCILIKE